MSELTYLSLAKRASRKEQEKQWKEAESIWRQTLEYVHSRHPNYRWAWARAEFCHKQRD